MMYGIYDKLLIIYTLVQYREIDKDHLRLSAATSVLKLSQIWDPHIPPDMYHKTVLMAKVCIFIRLSENMLFTLVLKWHLSMSGQFFSGTKIVSHENI